MSPPLADGNAPSSISGISSAPHFEFDSPEGRPPFAELPACFQRVFHLFICAAAK
jgi:hypothetical protein